jgi:hypothetical protein
LISASQVLRELRWVNLGSALALGTSCFVTTRPLGGTIACAVVTAILASAALSRGRVDAKLGGGWKVLWE